jgi:hypothetical protein
MPAMTRERQRRDTLQPGATPRVGSTTTDPSRNDSVGRKVIAPQILSQAEE